MVKNKKIIFGSILLLILAVLTIACEKERVCSVEAKACPDGSSVQRVPPSCQFKPCPAINDDNKGNANYPDEDVKQKDEMITKITDFDGCVLAGNPIMESYPRQCRANGETFVEDISDEAKDADKSKIKGTEVKTNAGNLLLSVNEETATISGALSRSTPCVDWKITGEGTKDMPLSEVEFRIKDMDESEFCIQVLGDLQEVKSAVDGVSHKTRYTVIFEDKIVYTGTFS